MGELGRGWCRGRARRAAPAEPGRIPVVSRDLPRPGPRFCAKEKQSRDAALRREKGVEKLFVADKFLYQGAWGDQLGTDGEEVAVALQQAFHRFTVFPGVLYLLQQAGDDSAV